MMKRVDAGVVDVAYVEDGPAGGLPVILLHGFPYDVESYAAVAQILANEGLRCIRPYLRGFGPTRFISPDTPRSGQQAALGADLLAFMDALSIERAVLAGFDWGGRAACVVSALWPKRAIALVSSGNGYNIQAIAEAQIPLSPEDEHRFWYQYYFHSERGRAALHTDRDRLCKYLWRIWSPTWPFEYSTFQRSAAAFHNQDFVNVVVHSYRHRFGLVEGDQALAGIESLLKSRPPIAVPALVLQGRDDGVDLPTDVDTDRPHFLDQYDKITIDRAGHNLPQEVPVAYSQAVLQLVAAANR
jgi:pimeloyl-ACP methyl ester carboxylesterase